MNVIFPGFLIYVKVIIYFMLCDLYDFIFKSGSHHLFNFKQKLGQKKVNDNCYVELMHLLKILTKFLDLPNIVI